MLFMREIPRWSLLAILIYAPWVYGSTRPWALDILKVLLLILTGLFLLSLAVERRAPKMPRIPAFVSLGALFLGWWLVVNARAVFDPVGPQFHSITPWINWLPGSMDPQRSLSSMLLVTGVLGAFWVATDMISIPRWRERLWLSLALIGASIILFGIVQRVTDADAIFWMPGEKRGKTFFATYRYHANAGAFINLVLPFILARTLLVLRQDERHWPRIFWYVLSLTALASAFLNVSRAAMTITVGLLAIFGVWWLVLERKPVGGSGRPWWLGPLATVSVVAVLAYAFGAEQSMKKWMHPHVNGDLVDNLRYQVYDIIWEKTLPAVGWGGSGPGTFEMVFPLSIKEAGNKAVGQWYWINAHQDYLQALVEWGVVGSLLWGGLLAGGFLLVCSRLLSSRFHIRTESRYLMAASALALLGVGLHAMVDFPLQIASLQLYAAVISSIAWMVGSSPDERSTERRSCRRRSGQSVPTGGTHSS